MTHTMPVAGSSPGLLDHRAQALARCAPFTTRSGAPQCTSPMTPSVHASQKEKGNDRSSANRPSA